MKLNQILNQVFFGENKEGFIFVGGQLSLGKENGNGKN